jgi:hypothetical protein
MPKKINDDILNSVLLNQNLGVLATTGKKYPYTSLVGFVPTKDMRNIVFATIKQTRKYNNIINHPEVSLLVNSSTNSSDDFKDAAAITIMGIAVTDLKKERKELEKIYLERFPFLVDFIKDPCCELVKIKVEKFIVVTRFQEVREIEIT